MVTQVDGGEPATAGGRSGGERRLEVRGAAVSSGGGHYGDGGARRWPEVALDGMVASATEGGGRLNASTDCLRQTVAQRSAWRGAEAHEGGARWSALRCLEEWSAATRE
jgi:hypothetical protein